MPFGIDVFGAFGPAATAFIEELTEYSRSLGRNDTRPQAGWSAAHWHARWVAAGSHDYRSMTIRQLRAHARARFGPQYWQELEARGGRGVTVRQLRAHARARFGLQYWRELEARGGRGGRHTALADLLYSTD